jgi:integrase
MGKKTSSFRIGRVRGYHRGPVWYLSYVEQGRRRQPRVGHDRQEARQMAAEINAQLEVGAPAALRYEPVSVVDSRQQWLDHHVHVRRSSVETVRRYRSATEHLIRFVTVVHPVRRASDFRPREAEAFVRHLRSLQVAPNGHKNARRRTLRHAGVKFILETCCSLFNYAQRYRHLPPYAENPFRTIEVGRIPIQDARPVAAFTDDQQRQFLEACDDWQFPVFLTLLLTGLRPGELVHLLLPNDLDLETGWLRVRNKPKLGWQVKTRNERDVPLVPVLADVLRKELGNRRTGPIFRQRRFTEGYTAPLDVRLPDALERELVGRIARLEAGAGAVLVRSDRLTVAKSVWRDIGALKEDWIRIEFKRITCGIGLPEITAPKTWRHTFATILQDANVDPLIRNELMGHMPGGVGLSGRGLGMTAVYTHTRPETKRRQLEAALLTRPAVEFARSRLGGAPTISSCPTTA